MKLTEVDFVEDKLFHPFASKVGPVEWLTIFFLHSNSVRTVVRASAMGAAVVWLVLKQDFLPITVVLVLYFLWDFSATIYWRRRMLFHRKQLEKTAEEMMKINREIEEKQKYFESKKMEYLKDHPEER